MHRPYLREREVRKRLRRILLGVISRGSPHIKKKLYKFVRGCYPLMYAHTYYLPLVTSLQCLLQLRTCALCMPAAVKCMFGIGYLAGCVASLPPA